MEMKINKTIKDSEQEDEQEEIKLELNNKENNTNRRYQLACDIIKNHAVKVLEYMEDGEPISFWLGSSGIALRLTSYSLRNAKHNVNE